MKTKFFIALLLLVASSLYAQESADDKRDRLTRVRCKVKTSTTTETDYYTLYGKLLTKTPFKSSTTKYDRNGNVVDVISYNPRGTVDSHTGMKLDSKGNILMSMTYKSDGSVDVKLRFRQFFDSLGRLVTYGIYGMDSSYTGRMDYAYDSAGNLTMQSTSDPHHIVTKNTYVYNKKGFTVKQFLYGEDGDFDGYFTYKYDANNNMIEQARYGEAGILAYTDVYKYNEKGLVTESTRYDINNNPVAIFKQTYEYYQ